MKTALKTLGMIVLLGVAGAAGLYYTARKADTQPEMVTVEKTQFIESVYATGEVEPVIWADVSPQASVKLEEVLVKEGMPVKKGDMLARADDRVEVAQLAQYESHLKELRNDLERNRALKEKGFATAEKLDATQSDYNETLAKIDSQKKMIDRLSVRAPVDGVVLRRDVEPGEVKAPGQVIFTIGQPDHLRIEAEVDEEDILRVERGQRVLIKSDALPENALEGEVSSVTPKGDPVNKNFRVRVTLPTDTVLRIGMTVELNIIVSQKDSVLSLPAEAVQNGFVMVWRAEAPQKTSVQTGFSDGQRVEIIHGLQEGDRVLKTYPAE